MALTLHVARLQGALPPENDGAGLQPAALPARCPRRAHQGQDIGRGVAQALRHSAMKLWRVQRRWKRQVRARLLLGDSASAPVTAAPPRCTDLRTSKPAAPKKRRLPQGANAKLSAWQMFFANFMKTAKSSNSQHARQHMREAAALWSAQRPQRQQTRKGGERRKRQRPELTPEESAERLRRKQEQMARARKARHAQKAPDPAELQAGLSGAAQCQLVSDVAAAGA